MTFLAGCEPKLEPIPPIPTQYLVQAVLDGSSRFQMISVERTENGILGTDAITGATVEIMTPQGLVMKADEDVNTPDGRARWNGMYRVDLNKFGVFRIAPGGTYTLIVQLPSGAVTISGKTTAPGPDAPLVVTAQQPFNRNTDTLRLSWPRAVGAAAYQVTIECALSTPRGTTFTQYSIFTDTSVVLAGTARSLDNEAVFVPNSTARVIVHALDPNYHAYYQPTTDPFAGAPPTRLTGGFGVFGSMTEVMSKIYSVR